MRSLAVALLAVCVVGWGPVESVRAEVTAEQVNRSIEAAKAYLLAQRNADGTWPDYAVMKGSTTSLCVLALLTAGVSPQDPDIQASLAQLRKLEPDWLYVLALQTMVFCMAEPEKDLLLIRRNVVLIEESQIREAAAGDERGGRAVSAGTWGYNKKTATSDNSNTQFALLALHEAERVGVETSEATWRLARDHWVRTQRPDGSWGYQPGAPGTGSMTCAGIASLIMADEKLSDGDAKVAGDRVDCCEPRQENSPVRRGLQWLASHFSVSRNPGDSGKILYYLYALERVGRMTNSRLIGGHDWYREGAETLVRSQAQLRGYWQGVGQGESDPVIGTALALLFVAKGRRPVLAAKLSFDPVDHWDRHRRDLAHLTDYCGKRWKRELTWQVVEADDATADDYNQAPVLYVSGSETPVLGDVQAKALRKYLDMGGFIFAENCCNGKDFDAGFRRLIEQMFPERDETGRPLHQLRLLPPEHAVWSAEEPVDPKYVRPLWGLDVGCRTSIVYCPENLGCYWELDRTGRKPTYPAEVEAEIKAVRSIGINVMAYATNREVKYKLEIPQLASEAVPTDPADRAKLYVAELKHNGGSTIAPTALVNLLRQLRSETGLRVSTEKRELTLTQDQLFDHHLVFMHGRSAFTLSDAERKQLRTFVERGGMLLADSVCSSPEFTAAFRREMQLVFPGKSTTPLPRTHPMLSERFGGFDLSRVTLYDPRRSGAGGPLSADRIVAPPELEVIEVGGRLGVVFSRYDLSCALERQNSLECAGYTREDAAKIGINVILFSLRGNL